MSEQRSAVEALISRLKQQRDELALQMHLGKAEVKEEWDRLTAKLDELSDRFEPTRDAAGEAAENVFSALKLVAGEIQDGFNKIRKTF